MYIDMNETQKIISRETMIDMLMAQDAAASQFWTYPDEHWQAIFQTRWLVERGFPCVVQDAHGIVWGKLEQ